MPIIVGISVHTILGYAREYIQYYDTEENVYSTRILKRVHTVAGYAR